MGHEPATPANDDPIAAARDRGWHVEIRPAGLLIDTWGQPNDRVLMDRLHAALLADQPEGREAERWPAAVLADPAEVVARGELERIERECGQ